MLGRRTAHGGGKGAWRGKDRLPTPFSHSIFSQSTHSNANKGPVLWKNNSFTPVASTSVVVQPVDAVTIGAVVEVLFQIPKYSPCENSRPFLLSIPHPLLSPFHEPSGPR